MALLNHERKFVYLFEPHTASRATELALLQLDGSKSTGNRHAGIRELVHEGYVTPEQASEYRVVCTVRNPLDSFITRWLVKSYSHNSDKMIEEIRVQKIQLRDRGLARGASDYVWYEHLDKDMRSLFGVEMPEADPSHKNKHKKLPWNDYYTLESFKLVSDTCRKYMDKFGYQAHVINDKFGVSVNSITRSTLLAHRRPI